MKVYYKNVKFKEKNYKAGEPLEEPDRVDAISYTPIGKQVENFIASGQIVTSLRATAKAEETAQKTLEEVINSPMTEFERHIYGMDMTEAYQILKQFDRDAEKREMDKKEAEERRKKIQEYIQAMDTKGVDTATN